MCSKLGQSVCLFQYKYPPHFSPELKDLISNLLQIDVTRRYGVLKNGVEDIKNHRFYASVDYIATYQKKVTPPFVPVTKGAGDDTNFDKYDEPPLPQSETCLYEKEFEDF